MTIMTYPSQCGGKQSDAHLQLNLVVRAIAKAWQSRVLFLSPVQLKTIYSRIWDLYPYTCAIFCVHNMLKEYINCGTMND
jgi:hypothetical protein